jgi:regulator of protease activity HflC (stomatin/prohibitin superfamily)
MRTDQVEQAVAMSRIAWQWTFRALTVGVLAVVAMMAGCPEYAVYKARKEGEAINAQSHGARQALVSQAQAELDAAQRRADAVKIMGQAAKDFPEYRQQEFIGAFAHAMQEGRISQIIYVPTEANIPITESRRLAPK